jgi:ATP phosphoribosyltransferase
MDKLRIAVQKSGRLSEKSLALFSECSINLEGGNGKLLAHSSDFPLEVLYLRDDDIPQYVYDGVADIGVVGENVVFEKGKPLEVAEKLGFGKCRLSLAIPKTEEYKSIQYFNNKRIATSYPVILNKFLKEKGLTAEIHEISGSVEIAPGIGLADSIFDIVSSGSTLFSNNLKEVEVLMHSEAVMVTHNSLSEAKRKILNDLIFRIRSVQKAKKNKYILLNAPNDKLDAIINIIPGMKSPSVVPLARAGWSSLHSVIAEKDFWEVIDKLQQNGAEGILVIPIEKMII